MRLLGPLNSGAAVQTGGAGTGTANTSSNVKVEGKVLGIYVEYNHSCPASTDVVIKSVGTEPAIPSQTLLTLSNANTSGIFLPRVVPQDIAGANLTDLTDYVPFALYDYINVLIDGADTADNVDVYFLLE
jgi:hypothetical protein